MVAQLTTRLTAALGMLAIWMVVGVVVSSPVLADGSDRPVSGVLAAANGKVMVKPMADPDARAAGLAVGQKVFFGDEIITDNGVRAQILLRDGTTFSIGEGANLVLDEFVYDPQSGDGGVGVVIKKGAFRFVSGKIAKKTPQNMKVLAGSTAIAVRGTEVIGTIGGGLDSVILISGQVDLLSVAGECAGGNTGGGGDMFSISPDGVLEFNADVAASPPAFCNRSLLRGGFGVQVAAGGQLSTPGRIETTQIDEVIGAVTIRSAASAPVSEAENEPEQTTEEAPAATPQSSLMPADDAGEQPAEAVMAAGQDGTGLLLPVSSLATESAATKPEEEGHSEFDKVVMRAFGMLDESQLTEEAKSAESSATVVDFASMQQQSGKEEDKPDEEGELGVPDIVIEEEIDDTSLTEEEKRNDARVEEATRELTDDKEEAESSSGGGGGGNSSPNTAPVLGSISGLAFNDTSSDDSFTNETGTLTATDSDTGDVLTYSISGGSSNFSLAGYDLARSSSYGTLYLNSSTGAYAYVPNDSAIEGTKTSVSDSFTLAVSDGSASATQTLTASINGAEDTPSLATLSGFTFTDTSANDSFSNVTGTALGSDLDSGETLTYAITGGSASNAHSGYDLSLAGSYGVLFLNSSTGAYSYVPNDTAMEATATNVSDSFSVYVSDGTASSSQTLTASIAGTDDGPSPLDMLNLSNVSGRQNVGATGLRFGIVTDPEGDTVTDQTSTLNALPAWLSFGSQVLGNGSVEYFWEVGANEAPWRAGAKTMNLKARSSGIDTSATSFTITFACQSDNCNSFLKSTDTESSPNVDDPTNIGSIRTGIKLGTEDFFILTEAERDALFDPSITADGTFRVIYNGVETGTGSPAGSWDIDQTVNVDYKSRAITVNGTVSANSIGYFDGGSDSFIYENSMAYTDTELGTYSVFGKTANTSGNATYELKNGNGDTVHVDIHDQIGFMRDANSVNAALINTNITPSAGNAAGYKDDSNQLIQQRWRLLEPQ
jgi:hypothetical protein